MWINHENPVGGSNGNPTIILWLSFRIYQAINLS
jgi:hypothetical protein